MRHSEDDAVHKIPQKMKTHWQNQLKFSVLIWFTILYRTRYKKMLDLSNAPLKHEQYLKPTSSILSKNTLWCSDPALPVFSLFGFLSAFVLGWKFMARAVTVGTLERCMVLFLKMRVFMFKNHQSNDGSIRQVFWMYEAILYVHVLQLPKSYCVGLLIH